MRSAARGSVKGFGLGARPQHYDALLEDSCVGRVDWLEVITENYLGLGGRPRRYLERLRERYPLALHGVSLSIGSVSPLDTNYLRDLRELADRLEIATISDHLCWTGVDGINLHDLLPLPFNEATLAHVSARIDEVQHRLSRRILIENVSSYIELATSEMSEAEFLAELARRSDCNLLLDVNNVYVSSVNHGLDARAYLEAMPIARVQQIHLAGHSQQGRFLIDTHDAPVAEPVWQLYGEAIARFGAIPTMIERDDRIPPLAELLAELDRAREIAGECEMVRA